MSLLHVGFKNQAINWYGLKGGDMWLSREWLPQAPPLRKFKLMAVTFEEENIKPLEASYIIIRCAVWSKTGYPPKTGIGRAETEGLTLQCGVREGHPHRQSWADTSQDHPLPLALDHASSLACVPRQCSLFPASELGSFSCLQPPRRRDPRHKLPA